MVGDASLRLTAIRRREFRALFVVSLLAHAGTVGFWAAAPSPGIRLPPGVVSVNLVSMPVARPEPPAAPKPAPKSVAVPPPPVAKPVPKPPVPEKVVLPKDPTPAASKPKPKPQPKPAPAPPPVFEEPVQKDYTDVLADLRSELGEPAPVLGVAETPAPAQALPSGGPGAPVSPEVAAWMRAVKVHVRRAWVVPPGFRTQDLETHVIVKLDPTGRIVGTPRIVRRSGNPWYDEGVVRAIEKASPLPAPPQADEWGFVFAPADSY